MKRPWFFILLSLASKEGYGTSIQDDVRALSDGAVRLWPATLYGSLEDLLEQGWIRELEPEEEPAGIAGRERFYRISPDGREALRAEVERIEGLAREARARLGESSAGA